MKSLLVLIITLFTITSFAQEQITQLKPYKEGVPEWYLNKDDKISVVVFCGVGENTIFWPIVECSTPELQFPTLVNIIDTDFYSRLAVDEINITKIPHTQSYRNVDEAYNRLYNNPDSVVSYVDFHGNFIGANNTRIKANLIDFKTTVDTYIARKMKSAEGSVWKERMEVLAYPVASIIGLFIVLLVYRKLKDLVKRVIVFVIEAKK